MSVMRKFFEASVKKAVEAATQQAQEAWEKTTSFSIATEAAKNVFTKEDMGVRQVCNIVEIASIRALFSTRSAKAVLLAGIEGGIRLVVAKAVFEASVSFQPALVRQEQSTRQTESRCTSTANLWSEQQ